MSSRAVRPTQRSGSSSSRERLSSSGLFVRATRHEAFNDVLFVGLLLALAWVPFRFGSNHLVAWGINAALFGLLTIAFEIGLLSSGVRHPVAPRRIWWAIMLFAGLVAWILFQLSPWAPPSWQSPFWQLTADSFAQIPDVGPVEGRISVTPDQGILGLVRLLTIASAFYLGLQLCRDRRRAELFLRVMVVVVAAYSTYGLIQLMFFPNTLLWIEKPAYRDFVTSTFINRNSFATYAGIGLIIAVGLLIEVYRRVSAGRNAPLNLRIATFMEASARALPLGAAAAVITIALLLTASRAGVMSTAIGVLILLTLVIALDRRRMTVLAVAMIALVMIATAMMSYGDALVERLAETDPAMRLAVTLRTFEASLDALWTGHGYGSFDSLYATYRDTDFKVFVHWDKAHNTYVELLFELGLPATLALAAIVVGIIVLMFANLLSRQSKPILSLIALSVSVQVLLHATVDFSLQIQAVAITFWSLLGAGLAQSWSAQIDTRL